MKIAVLDRCTVTNGDVDLSEIETLGEVEDFDLLPPDALFGALSDKDAVIVNKAVISGELMRRLPRLRYIGLFATGYNNIDVKAASELGVTVANVPGYSTDSVAQHAFALILEFACHASEYNASVHNGDWVRSGKFSYFRYPTSELAGKTLGIVGFGDIGRAVAKIGGAFGMRILVNTRTKRECGGVTFCDRETLFREADYLTLHAPLTDETRGMVNAKTLATMKKTAVLINTARGGEAVEDDLARALNEGVIAGAGIDVLDSEPMRENHPYLTAKNCIITPHIAWGTTEARTRLVALVCDNLRAYTAGEPRNKVN